MRFTKVKKQPPPRADSLAYDDRGPGLWPGEVRISLDDGELVAVAVKPTWLANNAGAEIYACARIVEADGSTKLSEDGEHVEVEFRDKRPMSEIEQFGIEAVCREFVLLVLGEPATVVDRPNPPEAIAAAEAAGESAIPPTFRAPIIPWAEDLRRNASVRYARDVVRAMNGRASDAAALLGL